MTRVSREEQEEDSNLHLDQGVLLRADPFTRAPVVVHARLAVLRGEDGVPLAVLDLLSLLQSGKSGSNSRPSAIKKARVRIPALAMLSQSLP